MDRDHVRTIADRFSEDAPLYERHWATSLARLGQRLVGGLPLADARVMVDIGAGVGMLLPGIRKAFPHAFVAGVDAAEGMIRRASPDFGRAVMDAGRMALRDGCVDAAVMPFMLFFLPDPPRGLAEVRRVLRPGGGIGVATWEGGANDFPALDLWTDILDEHGAGADPLPSKLELTDTTEKLVALLENAGFQEVRTATDREPVPMDLEEFIEVHTRLGRSKRRFETLAPAVRQAVLTEAGERLADLRPDDFTDPQVALFAWGTRPG